VFLQSFLHFRTFAIVSFYAFPSLDKVVETLHCDQLDMVFLSFPVSQNAVNVHQLSIVATKLNL